MAFLSVRSPRKAGCLISDSTCPLSEFYLTHQLGSKPGGRVLVLYLLVERLLVGA